MPDERSPYCSPAKIVTIPRLAMQSRLVPLADYKKLSRPTDLLSDHKSLVWAQKQQQPSLSAESFLFYFVGESNQRETETRGRVCVGCYQQRDSRYRFLVLCRLFPWFFLFCRKSEIRNQADTHPHTPKSCHQLRRGGWVGARPLSRWRMAPSVIARLFLSLTDHTLGWTGLRWMTA